MTIGSSFIKQKNRQLARNFLSVIQDFGKSEQMERKKHGMADVTKRHIHPATDRMTGPKKNFSGLSFRFPCPVFLFNHLFF